MIVARALRKDDLHRRLQLARELDGKGIGIGFQGPAGRRADRHRKERDVEAPIRAASAAARAQARRLGRRPYLEPVPVEARGRGHRLEPEMLAGATK